MRITFAVFALLALAEAKPSKQKPKPFDPTKLIEKCNEMEVEDQARNERKCCNKKWADEVTWCKSQ